MSLSDAQKVDIIWKKLAFGYATTDALNKAPINELIISPIVVSGQNLYVEANSIPASPPGASTSVVENRVGTSAVQCLVDPTAKGNRTWIPVVDVEDGLTVQNRLTDWIAPSFGLQYQVRVYAGDPTDGGTVLPSVKKNEEWYFDYAAGVLHFPSKIPSLGNQPIYIEGFRYIGRKGIGSFSQAFVLAIGFTGTELTSIDTPNDWSVEIDDPVTCTFTVTHNLDRAPVWISFFGRSPISGTVHRMRLPNTYTEVLFDSTAPNSFQITNATPFATGAQS